MVLLEGIYSTVIMRDILERENHKGQKRITDPVLLKKLRRGYDVSIGKIDNSEVDFIATNTNDKMYAHDKRRCPQTRTGSTPKDQ